jgi:hypothetical protein
MTKLTTPPPSPLLLLLLLLLLLFVAYFCTYYNEDKTMGRDKGHLFITNASACFHHPGVMRADVKVLVTSSVCRSFEPAHSSSTNTIAQLL